MRGVWLGSRYVVVCVSLQPFLCVECGFFVLKGSPTTYVAESLCCSVRLTMVSNHELDLWCNQRYIQGRHHRTRYLDDVHTILSINVRCRMGITREGTYSYKRHRYSRTQGKTPRDNVAGLILPSCIVSKRTSAQLSQLSSPRRVALGEATGG